jgi:hypothetical protein
MGLCHETPTVRQAPPHPSPMLQPLSPFIPPPLHHAPSLACPRVPHRQYYICFTANILYPQRCSRLHVFDACRLFLHLPAPHHRRRPGVTRLPRPPRHPVSSRSHTEAHAPLISACRYNGTDQVNQQVTCDLQCATRVRRRNAATLQIPTVSSD